MNLKRILATAIVWTGCAALGAIGLLFIWALVNAFIADWPYSLYAVIAIPLLIAAGIAGIVVWVWAWEHKWKP